MEVKFNIVKWGDIIPHIEVIKESIKVLTKEHFDKLKRVREDCEFKPYRE